MRSEVGQSSCLSPVTFFDVQFTIPGSAFSLCDEEEAFFRLLTAISCLILNAESCGNSERIVENTKFEKSSFSAENSLDNCRSGKEDRLTDIEQERF